MSFKTVHSIHKYFTENLGMFLEIIFCTEYPYIFYRIKLKNYVKYENCFTSI